MFNSNKSVLRTIHTTKTFHVWRQHTNFLPANDEIILLTKIAYSFQVHHASGFWIVCPVLVSNLITRNVLSILKTSTPTKPWRGDYLFQACQAGEQVSNGDLLQSELIQDRFHTVARVWTSDFSILSRRTIQLMEILHAHTVLWNF